MPDTNVFSFVLWSKHSYNLHFLGEKMISEKLRGPQLVSTCSPACTALSSRTLWREFNHNQQVSHMVLLPLKPHRGGRWVNASRSPQLPSFSSSFFPFTMLLPSLLLQELLCLQAAL